MLVDNLDKTQVHVYSKYIKAIASLSGLFSESTVPFLHYRTTETIFCKSFQAENLSRADIAYDARLHTIGIGLKTFIAKNGTSREKISEFNTHSRELQEYNIENLVLRLASLRNERIDFANRTYGIKEGIYHCLARQDCKVIIFETGYHPVDVNSIKNIKKTNASIFFEDAYCEYSFNFSKSTLYKKFYTPKNSITLDIEIINDPYELILTLFNEYSFPQEQKSPYIILPLYSTRNRTYGKEVPEKSGLNQWNAEGRKRDVGEVYIPVPKKIHQFFPNFFPLSSKAFEIILPTNDTLQAKICQESGKALMTNPNKALSQWLLRKVLQLKPKEILTYRHLNNLGIDSVKITKLCETTFKIDFAKIDSYEEFEKRTMSNS